MAPTPDEQALIDRFSATYQRLTSSEIMLGIERAVCGCDYGCTSWTTLDETRGIVEMLGLAPGACACSISVPGPAGRPFNLAQESGCDVTLSDLPLDGLLITRKLRCRCLGAFGRRVLDHGDGRIIRNRPVP